jgi:hypothetical protein
MLKKLPELQTETVWRDWIIANAWSEAVGMATVFALMFGGLFAAKKRGINPGFRLNV